MKIKIFNGYTDSDGGKNNYLEAQEQINDFIQGKQIIDIKISGSRDRYGFEMFQYVVIYKED